MCKQKRYWSVNLLYDSPGRRNVWTSVLTCQEALLARMVSDAALVMVLKPLRQQGQHAVLLEVLRHVRLELSPLEHPQLPETGIKGV